MSKESKSGWARIAAAAQATGPETAAAIETLRPKIAAAKEALAEAEKAAPPKVKTVIGRVRFLRDQKVLTPPRKKVVGVRRRVLT